MPDTSTNLIYRWRFDDDLTEEIAGNSMAATAGTISFDNSALPVSGTLTTHNAVVEATDAMDSDAACTGVTDELTIAFWYKSTEGNFTFLGWNDATAGNAGITFRTITGTGMRVTFLDSSYQLNGSTPVDDGNWHHIALTSNGVNSAGVKLYIDGVLDATGTGTDAVNNPDGTCETKASKAFEVDDLRLYSRELPDTDVAALAALADDPTEGGGGGIEGTLRAGIARSGILRTSL